MLRKLAGVAAARRLVFAEGLQSHQSAFSRLGLERVVSTSAVVRASEEQQPATPQTSQPAASSTIGVVLPPPPGITKVLGYGGLIPFYAFSTPLAKYFPLDLVLEPNVLSQPALVQVAYGATILSFLGGIHWGVAMTPVGGQIAAKLSGERYLWSVLPCLMAWPTVTIPVEHAAGLQAVLMGFVYMVDRAWARRGLLPSWYMNMRLPLTVGAVGGLALTAFGGGI